MPTAQAGPRGGGPGTRPVTLTTTVTAEGSGTRLNQGVTFRPDGLLGQAYLLVDLPAREAVIGLVHRRLLQDLTDLTAP